MQRAEIVGLIVDRLENQHRHIETMWDRHPGTNTRYFYVDDLLPEAIVDEAYKAFPRDADGFFSKDSFREKKRISAQLDHYAPILSELTYALQDRAVISKVAELTGMAGLEPDPSLYAGGLSMMFQDDFLNPHIDNSHDAKRDRYRRLNLLYYVSPDWKLENGGNFELWNEERTVPVTIVSKRNRFLVMETNKTSWHSVNKVNVAAPRCCVSNYYFSKVSPDQTKYFHVTSYDGRPDEPVKKIVTAADNVLRQAVSSTLKIGRGKSNVNKDGS